ncbi:MAG: RHS repeat protein [Gammaproteobacteria bacterium]|nr:RHS repeat protein [Gammaproteobacteria bacterium]
MALLPGLAGAHFITPQAPVYPLMIGPAAPAGSGSFDVVVNPSGEFDTCTVFARVTVGDSSIVSGGGELTAKAPSFTLTALKPGATTVTVYFEGLTNDQGFDCPAVVSQVITVIVQSLETSGSTPGSGSDADPVNTFSGELFMEEARPDLWLGGPMPLDFQRYYGSHLRRAFVLGDLGSNWRHNFDARLQWNGTRAVYTSWSGRVVLFDHDGNTWTQQSLDEVPYQLVTGPGVDARLFDPETDQVYSFDYTTGGQVTGKLVKIEDGRGNAHTVSYTMDGLIDSVTDGLGRTLTFHYHAVTPTDQIPKISSVSDGTRTVSFFYDDPVDDQVLTSVIDARGNTTTYRYEDTSGTADHALLLQRQRPEGNIPYTQTYYDTTDQYRSGRVSTQTDALGHVTTFTYDETTRTTTIAEVGGSVTRAHTHSAAGKLQQHRDENGNSIDLGYDGSGRRTGFVDRDGNGVSTSYHAPTGRPASVTHEDGTTSGFTYAARTVDGITWHDLASVTFADGSSESYTYDANGNRTGMTTRRGTSWSWTYNGRGQIVTETNPKGATATFAYNGDGTVASLTDGAGITTNYGYDVLRRLNRMTHADASFAMIEYDANDNITRMVDELGNETVNTYDRNNNLVRIRDAQLAETVFTYDALDRLQRVTNTEGEQTQFQHDERGRIERIVYPDGHDLQFGFDGRGQVVSVTDATGRTWTSGYSPDGALTASADPLGNTTAYVNDANKLPTTITSPRGFSDMLTRDGMGRVTRIDDALGRVTTISLDAEGLPTAHMLPGGVVKSSYARDALSLLTGVMDANNRNWLRARDSIGRITAMTDPLGRTRGYSYDARGRLQQVTFAGGLGNLQLSYDAAGRVTQKAYSDGTMLNFAYDVLTRLSSADGMSLAYDGATTRLAQSNGLAIGHDNRGRINSVTLAPGHGIAYEYDAAGRLVAVEDWTMARTTFSYDGAGRLSGIQRPSGVNTGYAYDADSQLTGITTTRGGMTLSSIGLTRDGLGRITSAARSTPSDARLLYEESHALTFDNASQVNTHDYDAEGRLLDDGEVSYQWDLASRLVRATRGSNTVDYGYNAVGQMTQRTLGGETRSFAWNHALGLATISVERIGGSDWRYYVHTPGGLLLYSLAAANNARRDYHFDETGNTLFLTNGVGDTTDHYRYSPFGGLIGASGNTDNAFTWQGQWGVWREHANGRYYMRARWYDPAAMRFLSRDPAMLVTPLEANPYQYASLDPLQHIDPAGLEPQRRGKARTQSGNTVATTCSAISALSGVGTVDKLRDFVLVSDAAGRHARAVRAFQSLESGLDLIAQGRAGVEGARANVALMREMQTVRAIEVGTTGRDLAKAKGFSAKAGVGLNVVSSVTSGIAEYASNKTHTSGGRVINAAGVGGTTLLTSTAHPVVAVVSAGSAVLDTVAENTLGVKPGLAEPLNNASRGLVAVGESIYRGDCRPMQSLTNKMIRGDFGLLTEGLSSAAGKFGENYLTWIFE